ncbi:MAG: hypothetical protein KDJ16_14885 [Hyphomicrobiales bacterium]|nr:hypothetical protein [Hyphomicrobiales bacterium]
MLRVILVHGLLFAAPFIGYGLYLMLSRRNVADKTSWIDAPIGWLALAGVILTIASLLLLASFNTGHREGAYAPARFEDGVLVPGRIE